MPKSKVAIAGATGFIGSALCRALARDFSIVALTRGGPRSDDMEWRRCDLYSLLDVERALEGCTYAVYLVHSMLPSARMTQASFEDLDLILADNFARAAASQGVRHVVYVGGLLPPAEDESLSRHLHSRLEVERTLGAYGVPVTALRAGLVVGAGGSSLHILTSLVRRLPAMLTPRWTRSPTQPIALPDLVRAVQHVLASPTDFVGAFDVGGPDVMSYRDMMKRTADVLGVKRPMLNVPLFTPGLSTLWVALITGAPLALVGPLVQSLRHEMTVRDNPLQRWLSQGSLGFEEALRLAIAETRPKPRLLQRAREWRRHRAARTVRSVQRLPRPAGRSASWIAWEYVRWLPTAPIAGLRCETEGPVARFYIGPIRAPLLVLRLSDERTREDRALFYVDGGLLARTDGQRPGRFEMRLTADGQHVLAAMHDFRPTLPWYLYGATQALAHLFVMHQFGRHLARIAPDVDPSVRAPAVATAERSGS
jgi:nucleoside-diphosphate-sugar epimerase